MNDVVQYYIAYLLRPVQIPSSHILFFLSSTNNKYALDCSVIFPSTQRHEAELALREGQENLDILRRQVVLGSLYPSVRSVMENSA